MNHIELLAAVHSMGLEAASLIAKKIGEPHDLYRWLCAGYEEFKRLK